MSNWLIFLYPYLGGIVEMLIEYYFFNRFLKKKISPIYYGLFVFAGIIITVLCQTNRIIMFASYVILFLLSGCLLGKVNIETSLLFSTITIEVMYLCYGIFNSLLSVFLTIVLKHYFQSIGYVFMGIGSILSLALSVLCYGIIEKHLTNDETGGSKYALMILAPTLLIFLASEYISREVYGNTVIINTDEEMLLNSNAFKILFMQCLGIASLFCILYAYKKIRESFYLDKQVSLLEQEIHLLNQYVKEARTRFLKTKSFRHDIKNHITVIKELLQNNKTESALRYMGDMETQISDMSFPVNTNNPVLDILLENKLGLALSRQISVECSLAVPYPSEINDIDFCIVLSNALDNAISACEQLEHNMQKFIHITGKAQGSFLMIEISNSFMGKNAVNRGTGIANINAVAEKYNGAMNIHTEGNVFTLSVLFIIPQHSDIIP